MSRHYHYHYPVHDNVYKKFFRDIFTGRDNRTYDMGRVLWFYSIQAFVAVTIYSLYKGGTFDPVTWGAGLAALITGGGAAIGLKSSTEPRLDEASPPPDYLDQVTAAKQRSATLAVKVEAQTGGPDVPDDPDAPQGR